MEITGEYQLNCDRETVWAALNDAEMLKKCIPGCESLEKVGDNEFSAKVTASIGPVKAKFNTEITLEDLNPPESYTMIGQSKSGAAGFGKGSAKVTLTEQNGGTQLKYSADFKVGGKLAQVGSRLVLGATRKTADQFFSAFSAELDPQAVKVEIDEELLPSGSERMLSKTWMAVGAGTLVLLIWWFLLR